MTPREVEDQLAALQEVQARHVDLLRHLPPGPTRPRTQAEWEALEAAESDAEYAAEVALGDWMTDSEQEWRDQEAENREIRAADSALEWLEWGGRR